MSCIAVTTVARPSEPTRTQAYEGGPPPPYQTWLARQALEPERALDEPGRPEGEHRWGVDLRAVGDGADVVARVEHLHRPVRGGQPPRPARRVDELAGERDERSVRAGRRRQALNG